MMRRSSSKLIVMVVGMFSALLMLAPSAAAEIVAPPSPPIDFGEFADVSAMTLNGEDTTVITVTPGATVTVDTTTKDTRYPTTSLLHLPIGFAGDPDASGCLLYRTQGLWSPPQTHTNVLTAPMVAGVYDVVGAGELTFYCGQYWNGTGQTFAKVVVVSADSLCALTASYSSDPDVAAGLCDKLAAWDKAMDRGNVQAAAGIMGAFENLLNAQTDKALTATEVETVLDLAARL